MKNDILKKELDVIKKDNSKVFITELVVKERVISLDENNKLLLHLKYKNIEGEVVITKSYGDYLSVGIITYPSDKFCMKMYKKQKKLDELSKQIDVADQKLTALLEVLPESIELHKLEKKYRRLAKS